MRKIIAILLALTLIFALSVPALAATSAELDKAVTDAAAYVLSAVQNPIVDSVGGEWAVIGLARSGQRDAAPNGYFEEYYLRVEQYVKECKGVLHERKYTEYSRVILGLTAAGYDPRNVAGYDLTKPLADFDKTVWQGINGPIWALIALDSNGYDNPQRDNYIAYIVDHQLDDGGWNLSGGDTSDSKKERSDPDITGMALQALARYQSRAEVKTAIDKALDCMSKAQDSSGGFAHGKDTTSESTVQVLVGLCALGISVDDPRFVKNSKTLVDNVLSFQNADGSFRHMSDGSGNNQMSTEQALYALVAAQRARDGKAGLYDMSGTAQSVALSAQPSGVGLPGKNKDVSGTPVTKPGTTFPDVKTHPNKTAIEALAAREIINGSDGKFSPDANVTRAQFAKMVTLALGLPTHSTTAFADMPSAQWAIDAIGTAYYYEIVNGSNAAGTEFTPNGNISRQDAAVMIARAAKLCGLDTARSEAEIRDTLAAFGDYKTVSSYALEPLAFCYSTKILDDSEFDIQPKLPASKAEIAQMLYNLLDKANLL